MKLINDVCQIEDTPDHVYEDIEDIGIVVVSAIRQRYFSSKRVRQIVEEASNDLNRFYYWK